MPEKIETNTENKPVLTDSDIIANLGNTDDLKHSFSMKYNFTKKGKVLQDLYIVPETLLTDKVLKVPVVNKVVFTGIQKDRLVQAFDTIVQTVNDVLKDGQVEIVEVVNAIAGITEQVKILSEFLGIKDKQDKIDIVKHWINIILDNIKIKIKVKGVTVPYFLIKFTIREIVDAIIERVFNK